MVQNLGTVYLLYSIFTSLLNGGLIHVQIFMCTLIVHCFVFSARCQDCISLMGNSSYASFCGVGAVGMKFTSGVIMQLKNM